MAPKTALRQNRGAANAPAKPLDGVQDKPSFKSTKKAARKITADNLENIEDPFNSKDIASPKPVTPAMQPDDRPNQQLSKILTELKTLQAIVVGIKPAIPLIVKTALEESDIHDFTDETADRTENIVSTVDTIEEEGAKESTLDEVNEKIDALAARVDTNQEITESLLRRVHMALARVEGALDELPARQPVQYIGCQVIDSSGRYQGMLHG